MAVRGRGTGVGEGGGVSVERGVWESNSVRTGNSWELRCDAVKSGIPSDMQVCVSRRYGALVYLMCNVQC